MINRGVRRGSAGERRCRLLQQIAGNQIYDTLTTKKTQQVNQARQDVGMGNAPPDIVTAHPPVCFGPAKILNYKQKLVKD